MCMPVSISRWTRQTLFEMEVPQAPRGCIQSCLAQAGTEWWMNHPQRAAIQAEPGLWTPLRCWGDEVAINKERSRTLVIKIRPL